MKPLTAGHPNPPRWAESVLRVLLKPRDRDTITGDLLEEYREVAFPTLGARRANVWYLKQAGSLMNTSTSLPSSAWLALGTVATATLFGLLWRSNFGPPVGLLVFALVSAALGISGLMVIRSNDIDTLWRPCAVFGVLCTTVLVTRIAVDTLAPRDVVEEFLAQSRGTYSQFNDPRRWLVGVSLVAIFLAAGFWGAWRSRDVRHGTVAAMAASAIGSLLTVAVMAVGMALSVMIDSSLVGGFVIRPGAIPMAPPVLLMISAVLGTLGATFGRGLSGLRREKASTT